MSPDVMTDTVGEVMEEEDHRGEIHTGPSLVPAPGHLFLGEGIGYLRGEDLRAMSAEEPGMEEGDAGLDPEATQYVRVGQGRGLFRVLALDQGRILRIQGIVEAGRGQPAGEGGVSVISGIVGRGRLRE